MGKTRKPDRRRPASGSRGGTTSDLWIVDGVEFVSEQFAIFHVATVSESDVGVSIARINLVEAGFEVGQILPSRGVWLDKAGAWSKSTEFSVEPDGRLLIDTSVSGGGYADRIIIVPFSRTLEAMIGARAGGDIIVLPVPP